MQPGATHHRPREFAADYHAGILIVVTQTLAHEGDIDLACGVAWKHQRATRVEQRLEPQFVVGTE